MGQTKKSHWRDYWSTNPLLEVPIFPRTMSRMSNNTPNTYRGDNLYQIRPLLDTILKLKSIYTSRQQQSWRGIIIFRTYNAEKITKYGILVGMLCESEFGYICNFEIYTVDDLHE